MGVTLKPRPWDVVYHGAAISAYLDGNVSMFDRMNLLFGEKDPKISLILNVQEICSDLENFYYNHCDVSLKPELLHEIMVMELWIESMIWCDAHACDDVQTLYVVHHPSIKFSRFGCMYLNILNSYEDDMFGCFSHKHAVDVRERYLNDGGTYYTGGWSK